MKYLPYVFKHLRRNWLRTASTVLAIAVCIFLFCTLQTILAAVQWGLKSANASRLVTRHAVSVVFSMPLSYKRQIEGVDGVHSVVTSNWFGGFLKAKRLAQNTEAGDDAAPDWSNFFENLAVEPEAYLALYPELVIPEEQRQAWFRDRRGALIGRNLANRYDWSIGDTFFLESFIPPYRKPDGPFEFIVQAIYDTDEALYPNTNLERMLFHFDYLYEGSGRNVEAGTYAIGIDDPDRAASISERIDELFANSEAKTRTETEAAFQANMLSISGNLAFLLNGIGIAVTFTILLVTANTMSMAVRERRTEIAVLKTLGFSGLLVMGLILGEALLIGVLGGGLGLVLGRGMIAVLPSLPFIGDAVRAFPHLGLSPQVAGLGFGVSLFIACSAGFIPAYLAYRARITDMLRRS